MNTGKDRAKILMMLDPDMALAVNQLIDVALTKERLDIYAELSTKLHTVTTMAGYTSGDKLMAEIQSEVSRFIGLHLSSIIPSIGKRYVT